LFFLDVVVVTGARKRRRLRIPRILAEDKLLALRDIRKPPIRRIFAPLCGHQPLTTSKESAQESKDGDKGHVLGPNRGVF